MEKWKFKLHQFLPNFHMTLGIDDYVKSQKDLSSNYVWSILLIILCKKPILEDYVQTKRLDGFGSNFSNRSYLINKWDFQLTKIDNIDLSISYENL